LSVHTLRHTNFLSPTILFALVVRTIVDLGGGGGGGDTLGVKASCGVAAVHIEVGVDPFIGDDLATEGRVRVRDGTAVGLGRDPADATVESEELPLDRKDLLGGNQRLKGVRERRRLNEPLLSVVLVEFARLPQVRHLLACKRTRGLGNRRVDVRGQGQHFNIAGDDGVDRTDEGRKSCTHDEDDRAKEGGRRRKSAVG